MLFRLDRVSKEFGNQLLFSDVCAQCNPESRVGLIGRNGTGKTTLLNIVQGLERPDQGSIQRASALEISRISQMPDFAEGATVRQEALRVFDHLRQDEERMRRLEERMAADGAVSEEVSHEYDLLSARHRLHGGYDYRARTEAVLLGLGFDQAHIDASWRRLSGGQRNRLLLAQSLLRPADLMLLDEPTNHLDLEGILWLTRFLDSCRQALLVISHDRRFLDAVTTETWEIEGGSLLLYPGGYSLSRRRREERRERERALYEREQEWKSKTEDFIRRNIAGQKTKQAQSRRRQLAKRNFRSAPANEADAVVLRIREGRRGGSVTFRLHHADIGHPGRTLLADMDLTVRRGDRIGLIGGNGSGKTTLLKTLIGELPVLGGEFEWGQNNDLAYYSQEPTFGDERETVFDFLRRFDPISTDERLRSYAALFLFCGDDVFKPIQALSGGERSRLALARLTYEPVNVLFMDEPTNHLDIAGRESLEEMLRSFSGTLVVVSHDLYFLKQVVERCYHVSAGRLIALESPDDLLQTGGSAQRGDPFQRPASSDEGTAAADASACSAASASSADPAGGGSVPNRGLGPHAPKTLSKNELRRRRDRLADLETCAENMESELEDLSELMQKAAHDFQQLRDLTERHERVARELESTYREWEDLAEELALVEH